MHLLIFTQKWPRTFLRRYLWSIATMYACVCRDRNHIAQAMQKQKKKFGIYTHTFLIIFNLILQFYLFFRLIFLNKHSL